jgi:hypothetical protein
VAAVAAGYLILAWWDPFGSVESFSVVARSTTGDSLATWISKTLFSVMLVAWAVGILWFCVWRIRRRKNDNRGESPRPPGT